MSSLKDTKGGFADEYELQKNRPGTGCQKEHTPDILKNLKMPPIEECPNNSNLESLNMFNELQLYLKIEKFSLSNLYLFKLERLCAKMLL